VYYTLERGERQEKSERNEVADSRKGKLATLALPAVYDCLNVIVSERVGHIQPVDAVVRAGIPIGCPAQPASGVVNGKEKSSELAGHMRCLLHVFHYNLLSAECKGKL
jgi:hypothetical protein